MAVYHCPNLTIVDEHEIRGILEAHISSSVCLRPPKFNSTAVTRKDIQVSLFAQFGLTIPLERITKFCRDFIVVTNSSETVSALFEAESITIANEELSFSPLSIDYAGITLPVDDLLPNNHTGDSKVVRTDPSQQIIIKTTGLPPHLCYCEMVNRLFTNICTIANISLNRDDSSYTAVTYAPKNAIPRIANVGIRVLSPTGHKIYVWELRNEVVTPDLRDPLHVKLLQPVNDLHRASRYGRPALFKAPKKGQPSNQAQSTASGQLAILPSEKTPGQSAAKRLRGAPSTINQADAPHSTPQ